MTSIKWSNDIDPIKTMIFGYPKSMATFQFSYTHRAVFIGYEFLHGVEESKARAREARTMHFCTPRREFAHAQYKLEFGNAEER